tara:strand:+ start:6870 stop:7394 length:525 start_codon:yes stop_codon:yes gene_type:complete
MENKPERKQRAKAPPKPKTYPKKATPKSNHYFSKLMSTPEGRALRKQWSTKPRKNAGRPKGVPDGYRKDTIAPLRAQAKIDANKVVEIMSDKYNIEDEYQKEALHTAVEVMRLVGETRERLAAARLVLDFTKSKPASKSDVSISKAEDFLASLLQEDEQPDAPEDSKDTEEVAD